MNSRLLKALAPVLALGLLAAACGGDDDTETSTGQESGGTTATTAAPADSDEEVTPEEPAEEAPAETQEEEAAPPEEDMEEEEMEELSGRLVWWSDWTIEQTEAFIDAFNEVHPGVTVEYTRSDDSEMYNRFVTESGAGTIDADIVIIGWDGFSREWDGNGWLHSYNSPEGAALHPDLRAENGTWHTYGTLLEGICHNTERTEELGLDAPTQWEDLADPQYKDEIVMQDILKVGSGAHDLMIETRVYWDDDDRWEAFWQGYGANNIVFQTSYTEAQQQLVQGNFAVLGLCYLDFVQPSIDQGAPVVWSAPEPVVTVGFTVNIPVNAPNKENAEAFVDFILGEDGQAAVADVVGQVPARPGAPFPEAAKVAEGVPQILALGTPRAIDEFNNNAEWYVDLAKEWFDLR